MQLSALELFQHDAGYSTREQEGWDRLVMRMLSICDKSGPVISAWTLRAADASTLGTLLGRENLPELGLVSLCALCWHVPVCQKGTQQTDSRFVLIWLRTFYVLVLVPSCNMGVISPNGWRARN